MVSGDCSGSHDGVEFLFSVIQEMKIIARQF
jgi:hypothetical protein